MSRKQASQFEGHELTLIGADAKQLLCKPQGTYQISSYQIEIMHSRKHSFLLPEWVEEMDNSYLLYDKEGLLSLEQYVLDQGLNREKLFYLLWQVSKALLLCEDSLLDQRELQLSEQTIFLTDEKDSRINAPFILKFLYIPVESKKPEPFVDLETALMADLVEWCIEHAKEDNLLLSEEISTLRQYVMGDIHRFIDWNKQKYESPEKPKRKRSRKTVKNQSDARLKDKDLPSMNPFRKSKDQNEKPSKLTARKQVLINLVLLVTLNISLGFALKEASSFYYILTALGLLCLIANNISQLLQTQDKKDVSNTKFERERQMAKLRALDEEMHAQNTEAAFSLAAQKKKEDHSIAYLYYTTNSAVQDPDDIIQLRRQKPAAVILNREFYIGSDQGRCDFQAKGVDLSPLHARISRQDGTYLLTDLASEQGTYLNKLQLHYYEDYVLYHGACISFGEASFIFMTQEALDSQKELRSA